ncbi:hypothetical protein WI604_23450 [Bradyrhizobium symbiodeficiens]|uniref:hypothetical protein n=1 Tax=Bradyrhizobium symbiodeficiens TaxID=1404367 RepID=UPI0030D2F475
MAEGKSTASSNRILNRVRAQLTKVGSIHRGLANYKISAEVGELRKILPLLLEHPAYRSFFWPAPTPRSYNSLGAGGIPSLATFERELVWCVQTLLPYADVISNFVQSKRRFEEAFLKGDQSEVWAMLELIERQFGVSLWLAEANINALQSFKGYSAQQEYANAIARTRGAHPLIRYIVSWMSSRASQNIAAPNFYALLDDMVPLENGFARLAHLTLGDCRITDSNSAASVLSFADMLPVVDRYLIALATFQGYAANLEDESRDAQLLRQELGPLVDKTRDPSLTRLAMALGIAERIDPDTRLLLLIEDYVVGKYQKVAREADELLHEQCSIEALVLLLQASRQLEAEVCPAVASPSLLSDIAEDLWKIINFNDDTNEAYTRLSKVILTNASSAWAATLSLVVDHSRKDGCLFGFEVRQIYCALRAAHEAPKLAMAFLNLNRSGDYLAAISSSMDGTAATGLVSACMSNLGWSSAALEDVPRVRLFKWQALTNIRLGNPIEGVKLLRPLYEEGDKSVRCELGQGFAEGLLRSNDLLRCAQVCVDLFQSASSFASLLPLDKLLTAVSGRAGDSPIDVSFHGQLSIVLIFDIYSRFVSSNRDPERADAFKDFLLANGIQYASELINLPDRFPREQLVQFLKYVCIPEVLDQSLALESTRAVEDERSRILVLLSELTAAEGKPPSSELLEELSTIKTRQVVRETTLKLDQSKVYVNVDGIKKAVSVPMREMWSRYRLLTSQQGGTDLEELRRILEVALGERVAVLSLTLPLTEGAKLFARIVSDLLEMFSLSKEFGLDANLSTNIRHGFVMREIRGPLLSRHLVTNKTSADGSYLENAYWMERLCDCYDSELSQISAALATFSEKVDAEIEHLNRRLIRIRSEQAPEGLFDFSIDNMSLQLLQRRCDKATTFDEFIDTIIEFLWGLTNRALERLRDVLFSVTLANLYSAVDDLQDVLGKQVSSDEVSALTSAANLVRPDLRSAVERVASWFALSGSNEYQDYDLRISYEAGLATVKSYYSHLSIVSEFDSPTILMAGRTLPFFARLFSILLDNSAFHSGLVSGALLLRTKAWLSDGLLHLSARNNLAPTVDSEFVRKRISRVNSDFGRERASNFIREEGGSGYPKIWKILAHDLGGGHAVQVSLTPADEFLVEIVMEAKGIAV